MSRIFAVHEYVLKRMLTEVRSNERFGRVLDVLVSARARVFCLEP